MTKKESIEALGAAAKLNNRMLAIWDHRYLTAAKEYTIYDDHIVVTAGYHIEEIGTLGAKAQKAVKLAPGGRIIMMDAILEAETIIV